MSARKKRAIEVFSMSFLDCICCGFGAVILIFVITTGRGLKQHEGQVSSGSSMIRSLEQRLEQAEAGVRNARAVLSAAKEREKKMAESDRAALEIGKMIGEKKKALAVLKEKLAKVQEEAELAQAEKESAILQISQIEKTPIPVEMAAPAKPSRPIRQIQPPNLTEFSTEGRRVLILLEASGGMLGNSINEAMDQLRLPPAERMRAEKWVKARHAVRTLMAYLNESGEFQVVLFNKKAFFLYPSNGSWLKVNDAEARAKVLATLDNTLPEGGANLESAFTLASNLRPDNILLIVDGLPTLADTYQAPSVVTEAHRLVMMQGAIQRLPPRTPLNIILFPMAGDPAAAPHFWMLSQQTKGSMITPARSWPVMR